MDKKAMVEALVSHYTNGNKAQFASILGVSAQTISAWVARNTLDTELVYSKCSDLSADWLLTGRGTMLKTADSEPIFSDHPRGVPFFDVDFCGGFDLMVNDQTSTPAGYIDFPEYNRADSWARITGRSMEPLISNGDIIALRKIEDWESYLLYGEIYGVMTAEYRTVKRVRKADRPDKLLLEPINKDYDTTEIRRDMVTGMWHVLGCAKKFF